MNQKKNIYAFANKVRKLHQMKYVGFYSTFGNQSLNINHSLDRWITHFAMKAAYNDDFEFLKKGMNLAGARGRSLCGHSAPSGKLCRFISLSFIRRRTRAWYYPKAFPKDQKHSDVIECVPRHNFCRHLRSFDRVNLKLDPKERRCWKNWNFFMCDNNFRTNAENKRKSAE